MSLGPVIKPNSNCQKTTSFTPNGETKVCLAQIRSEREITYQCFAEISFLPEVDQSSLKVVSPKTWSIVDRYETKP